MSVTAIPPLTAAARMQSGDLPVGTDSRPNDEGKERSKFNRTVLLAGMTAVALMVGGAFAAYERTPDVPGRAVATPTLSDVERGIADNQAQNTADMNAMAAEAAQTTTAADNH